MAQQSSTYICPYCFEDGLNEQQLIDHVMSSHEPPGPPVACPICANRPGGNPK
jgi:hypothetical protein